MSRNARILTSSSLFSEQELQIEANRLFETLKHLQWTLDICYDIADLTLEINKLKKEKNIVILAHSYQTPDIIYGVADHKGDSYGLSKIAQKVKADGILFAGVHFMAETAKILNPDKQVLISDPNAGCSLSESITGADIRQLKREYPGIPVVTYINTSADVKAETDIIVTSANAPKIIRRLEAEGHNRIIFLPDKYMAGNLKNTFPNIDFIQWHGVCIVHEEFTREKVHFYREQFGNDLQILVHTECAPEVVSEANMAGGTTDMVNFISDHPDAKQFMLVTECGLVDRLKIEFPDREFVGSCNLCPYMKKITLHNILETLKNPQPENIVTVDEEISKKALQAITKMFEYTEKN
jgi:quinolinate synthase